MIWTALERTAAADRGPSVRETHPGTLDKLWWWHRYCAITTKAMVGKERPAALNYIDLFAGPGILSLKSGDRKPGSPMIAAHTGKPFDRMIFCEMKPRLAEACRSRLHAWGVADRSEVLVGDCNLHVGAIADSLRKDSLSLAFIDPTGLQFTWFSLERLTDRAKVDFLLLIPDRMDIHRNRQAMLDGRDGRLEAALGPGSGWREELKKPANQSRAAVCRTVESLYRKQLHERLGYKYLGSETISKIGGGKQRLYTILFASRHPLGLKFWNESVKRDREAPQLDFE